MITAVDSNVLMDVLEPDPLYGRAQASDAGAMMAAYRRRGGARARVVADFLVGAHARGRAERLLPRDRGFFRSYFVDLEIVDPSAA